MKKTPKHKEFYDLSLQVSTVKGDSIITKYGEDDYPYVVYLVTDKKGDFYQLQLPKNHTEKQFQKELRKQIIERQMSNWKEKTQEIRSK